MEQTDLEPLIEELSTQVTALETALKPLTTSLSHSSSQLPLLDRAKLNVLTTYAIESLLFSYLRLNGQQAKEHPVFEELTRVKQYFVKIKAAEDRVSGADQPKTKLDKGAAGRFIKHGLAGNDKHDRERAEREAAEKQRAWAKADELERRATTRHRNSGDLPESQTTQENGADEQSQHVFDHTRKRKRKLSKAPKSGHEAFQALLAGQKDQEQDTHKKKKNGKKAELEG